MVAESLRRGCPPSVPGSACRDTTTEKDEGPAETKSETDPDSDSDVDSDSGTDSDPGDRLDRDDDSDPDSDRDGDPDHDGDRSVERERTHTPAQQVPAKSATTERALPSLTGARDAKGSATRRPRHTRCLHLWAPMGTHARPITGWGEWRRDGEI